MTTLNPRGAEMVSSSGKRGTKAASLPAVLLMVVFLLCTGVRVARAQCGPGSNIINWTGAGLTGLWSFPLNWDAGCTPNNGGGAFFNVFISSPGNTITFDNNPTTIDSLVLDFWGGPTTTLQSLAGSAESLTIGSTNAAGCSATTGLSTGAMAPPRCRR